MALVKSVQIDIGVKGDTASKAKLDAISARAEELKKAFPEYALKIDSAAASQKLAIFKGEMKSVADSVTKPMDPVVLTDKAKAKLEDIRLTAERLKAKFPEFTVRIDDTAAKRKLALFAAEAAATTDKIDRKLAGAGNGGGILSRLPGLGGGAGGAGAGSAGLLPAASGLVNPYTITAGLAALPFAAQAAGGAITFALGGGITAAAVIFAAKNKEIRKQFGDLAAAASKDMSGISAPFVKVLSDIARTAKTTLPEVMKPLGDAIKTIAGPFDKFATTLIKAFGSTAVGDSLKAVGKAFGSILTALKPMLPGMITTIATGITRIANTIKDNPKAFADFVWFLTHVAGDALNVVAWLTAIANYAEKHFIPAIGDVVKAFEDFRHRTAVIFDGVRHDIAHTWDQIWNNTVGRVKSGIADVVGWFRGMPGRVTGALFGLGHQLYAIGHSVLTEFWNGLQSVGGTVISWIGNFAKNVWSKVKQFFGINSPSSLFYDIGKNLMLGLFHGIKDHAWKAANLAQQASAGITGAFSGSVAGEQKYAQGLFSRFGWGAGQLAPLIALWNQESGWNPLAMNQSSGAFGIAQALGHGLPGTGGKYGNQYPSKAANEGNAGAQIAWGLSYIRSAYGSPAAAWAHELSQGWYDKGGWLMPGLTMAVNNTGRPEQVIPPGGGELAGLLADIADGVAETNALLRSAPGHTGRALGDALNGVARSSAYSSMYGSR